MDGLFSEFIIKKNVLSREAVNVLSKGNEWFTLTSLTFLMIFEQNEVLT